MYIYTNFVILWILSLQVGAKTLSKKSIEKTLIRDLMNRYEHYGVSGRPLRNSSNIVHVQYGLALIQILGLDEDTQVLKTNCWIRYKWYDELMKWNVNDYGNITQIRVFEDQIWIPDIQLFNMADTRLIVRRDARLVVYSNGIIMWVPQALFKSSCSVEITYFPYDVQICRMDFGSWTYDITQLGIDFWVPDDEDPSIKMPMPYVDFKDYIPSNEWITDGQLDTKVKYWLKKNQIRSLRLIKKRNVTDGGTIIEKQYPLLRYRVRMRRKPDFYVFILIIPCVLLSLLVIIVFWLPPESPAKLMLGMNIFVAFFVLMLLLKSSIPTAVKNFPLIGSFFCLNMIMITLSTFLVTIVINFYIRGDRKGPIPYSIRRIMIDGMGRFLYVSQFINLANRQHLLGAPKPEQQNQNQNVSSGENNIYQAQNIHQSQHVNHKQSSHHYEQQPQQHHHHHHHHHHHQHQQQQQQQPQQYHQQQQQQHQQYHQHQHHHHDFVSITNDSGNRIKPKTAPILPTNMFMGMESSCQNPFDRNAFPVSDSHTCNECCCCCCEETKLRNRQNQHQHHNQHSWENAISGTISAPPPAINASGPILPESPLLSEEDCYCNQNNQIPVSNPISVGIEQQTTDPESLDPITGASNNSNTADEIMDDDDGISSIEKNVREIRRFVRQYVSKQKEVHRRNQMTMEWRTLALVLDRLFCIFYIATIIIAVIVAVPTAADLKKMEEEPPDPDVVM